MNGLRFGLAFRARDEARGERSTCTSGRNRTFSNQSGAATTTYPNLLSGTSRTAVVSRGFTGVAAYRSQMNETAPGLVSAGANRIGSTPAEELDRVMIAFLLAWSRLRGRMNDPEAMRELLASLGGHESNTPATISATESDSVVSQPMSDPLEFTPKDTSNARGQTRPVTALTNTQDSQTPNNQGAGQSIRAEMQVFSSISMELRATFFRQAGTIVGTNNDGLAVINAKTIETERYRINFETADTIRITDRVSGQYTRVWGDPHVDVSTIDGVRDGEFSDLKASADITTFELQDGTTIRFNARDRGVIEGIDVMRGETRIHGTGIDTQLGQIGIFHASDRANDLIGGNGDVVHAGNDGASWYDGSGKIIWGRDSTGQTTSGTRA